VEGTESEIRGCVDDRMGDSGSLESGGEMDRWLMLARREVRRTNTQTAIAVEAKRSSDQGRHGTRVDICEILAETQERECLRGERTVRLWVPGGRLADCA
jgi:hypothetical protein